MEDQNAGPDRADGPSAPAPAETEERPLGNHPIPIVGIGASAGGLAALEKFFERLPPVTGMAFVVVQHLSPQHASLMPEIIGRHTALPVEPAADGATVLPDHVYFIPPDATLTIMDGVLQVEQPRDPRRAPIDAFFQSLAEDQGPNAVCIVLSGGGSDGTLGLRAIKEHGGIAMAQAADTAQYDSMPRSAIALGLVDDVLPAEQMPERLVAHAKHLRRRRSSGAAPALGREETARSLQEICALLQHRTGNSFTQYKQATLVRRIQRRLHLLQLDSLATYVARLKQEPDEIDRLFNDLLIGVTRFFRDPEVFDILGREVITKIVASKKTADCAVRVWVPGCSSGEEAYSIAILLREAIARAEAAPSVKIFATDIDEGALEVARIGYYPEGIAEQISPERLERFFQKRASGYQVGKELREMCIFSVHNLVSSPPFSHLDLISCRNLLIYLEAELQQRILPVFHYALTAEGYLLLGPSESLTGSAELFRTVDKRARIFQRKDGIVNALIAFPPLDPTRVPRLPNGAPRPPTRGREQSLATVFQRVLVENYAPPAVVVNAQGEIVYVSGRTGKYLELPPGLTNLQLLDMAPKEMRPALHAALRKAVKSGQEIVQRGVAVKLDGEVQRIDISIRPLPDLGPESSFFMVIFQESGPAAVLAPGEAWMGEEGDLSLVQQLEQELQATKQHLQTTIEELEASNEELRSTNEELLSTNEELQSFNEEMQTSKEELQSMNEELQTLNIELSRKVEELDQANSDLQNLFASTHIATVFLDSQLHIKRFSPAAREVFRLIEGDVGRPITDITATFSDGSLEADAQEVLRTLVPRDRQVYKAEGDRWYILRMRPYRSLDNVIDGVVITFVDITELKRAEERIQNLAAMVESSQEAIIGASLEGTITSWNAGAAQMFGCAPQEAIGRPVATLFSPEDVGPMSLSLAALARGELVAPFEVRLRGKDGAVRHAVITLSAVKDQSGAVVTLSAVVHDITERKQVVEALKEADRRKNDFLAVLGHELRNPLAPIRNAVEVIRHLDHEDLALVKAREIIGRQVRHMARLIDDLLDVSRLSTGKMRLVKAPVDLVEIVRATVSDYRPDVTPKRITLEATLAEGPLWVHGDGTRLAEVTSNLLYNALKFTEPGGRIAVEVTSEASAAILRVRDTGVGMDPETLARLFEPFAQADRSLDRAQGGLGLGLALVKGLITLHEGSVEARSDGPGRGAEFVVRLPLTAAPPEKAKSPPPALPEERPRRVLVIEDNTDVAESMRMLLELEGHEVRTAFDGPEGVEAAAAFAPDLVLCDIGLPGAMSGYDVARALRGDPRFGATLLVALTGYGQEEDKARARAAGFDEHLTKPADDEALLRVIARAKAR